MRFKINQFIVLALLVFAFASKLTALEFVVHPYLRFIEKESIVISFEFDQKASGELLFGTDKDKLDKKVAFESGEFHELKLSGLTPETVYHYRVQPDAVSEFENPDKQYFKTLPVKAKPFIFAAYGDTASGVESYDLNHQWVLQSVMEHTFPDFVVITGDTINDGSKLSNWHRFFELEQELIRNVPIYGIVGNNDSMGIPNFEKYFLYGEQETQYSFDYNDCHFIVLNIIRGQGDAYYNSIRPGNPQFKWLLKDLQSEANTKANFTFVFVHAPIISPDGRGNIIVMEMLHPIFRKYGVDMVFGGTHTFSRGEKDGIQYYITGGGGAELRETKARDVPGIKESANLFHHMRVHVNYPVVIADVVDLRGSTHSSFTYWDPEVEKDGESETSEAAVINSKVDTAIIDEDKRSIPLKIFSLPSCGYCKDLMDKTIPRIAENMDVNIPIDYHSLNAPENFEKLIQLEHQLNDKDNELPVVIIGNKLLGGEDEINSELQKLIFIYSKDDNAEGIDPNINPEDVIREKFESFKILPIVLAGLLDGVNPCAFTTIIFLLSYLIYLGKSKKEVLVAGIAFSGGVFITYMVIGLGFSEILSQIQVYGTVSEVIKYVTFILVLVLALLNLYDVFKIRQGKEREIALKLPKQLRRKIQDKVKEQSSKSKIVLSSFGLGFFVSTFELACTGQMYVPTLIYMLQVSDARIKALGYLLLYNLMFILPLILVFLAVYFGLAQESVIKIFRKNVFAIKLFNVFLFFGLAVFILYV